SREDRRPPSRRRDRVCVGPVYRHRLCAQTASPAHHQTPTRPQPPEVPERQFWYSPSMKALRVLALIPLCSLTWFLSAQQRPRSTSSETVGKSKKAGSTTKPEEAEKPKIPSQYKKNPDAPAGTPVFSSDSITVSVDVAVLDNKGHFIPNIPKNNF